MARLLQEIDWLEPTLPLPDDPEWAAEVIEVMGRDIPSFRFPARSRWLRKTYLQMSQMRSHRATDRMHWLAVLVTSQENSCRFCYGVARAQLKVLGLDDAQLEKVEREVRMAGADENERAVLQFCRNLSRSSPRPARSEFESLVARGLDRHAMTEIACAVAAACFSNRVATFLAVPLDAGIEGFAPKPMKRLFMRLMRNRYPRPISPLVPPRDDSPFAEVVSLVKGTEGASVLDDALRGAFASPVLPVRTKAWVFSVVARVLGCRVCERGAGRLLEREGILADRRERILSSLSGPELDTTESVLLPWVRETARYQTEVMQRKTHELRDEIGEQATLEAIGVAALANSCARISMLAQ